MPDTRELKSFIKLKDLTITDTIKFIDGGKIEEKDFSKEQNGSKLQKTLVIMASLNGESPKELTLNNTTVNILSKTWGPNSDDWAGKTCKVTVIDQMSFGELKELVILKPIEAAVNVEPPLQTPNDGTATLEEQSAWDN